MTAVDRSSVITVLTPLPVVWYHRHLGGRGGGAERGRRVPYDHAVMRGGRPRGHGDPGSKGGGSAGTVLRPLAHEGRELDVRRLKLGRLGGPIQ